MFTYKQRQSQKGFTLIELIVVIAILGALSAFALPRFAALQTEARIAKMNGALASLKAGAILAKSTQITQQLGSNVSVNLEGAIVPMQNNYPTTALTGIATAAGLSASDFVLTVTSATVFTVASDPGHPNCNITYTVPTGPGVQPVYSNVNLTATNCS